LTPLNKEKLCVEAAFAKSGGLRRAGSALLIIRSVLKSFFAPDAKRPFAGLFTFGFGVGWTDCKISFIRLTLAVGTAYWLFWTLDCENLTTPKTASTIKCSPIETAHAQNVILPLLQPKGHPCEPTAFNPLNNPTILWFFNPAKNHSVIL